MPINTTKPGGVGARTNVILHVGGGGSFNSGSDQSNTAGTDNYRIAGNGSVNIVRL